MGGYNTKGQCFHVMMSLWSLYIVQSAWIAQLGCLNSLIPGKFEWHFRYLIFQIISVIDGWGISCELALRWMSFDLTDDKSTLGQVIHWCRQATSHYLSQWWPKSCRHMASLGPNKLTFKHLGNYLQCILFSNTIPYKCDISASNWSNTMKILSPLWIHMAWSFSTKASAARVLSMHLCISSCYGLI